MLTTILKFSSARKDNTESSGEITANTVSHSTPSILLATPPGINRLVINTGDVPGTMMVLFDTTRRDPNEGITMPAHVIAEERASGKDYTRRALDGVLMTPGQVNEYVSLYENLKSSETDGDHIIKRVIRTSDPGPPSRIRTT